MEHPLTRRKPWPLRRCVTMLGTGSAGDRAAGKTIVFTNGVFDLLHPGHLRYLQHARALGDALIVGVNSDRSVARQNKGPDRPITPEAERAEMLAALACVDGVVIFDEDTPHDIIAALQPDVLVKGADWAEDAIVGRDIVEARRREWSASRSSRAIRRRRSLRKGSDQADDPKGFRGRTTSTSLNLRAVLKTAVAQRHGRAPRAASSGLTPSGEGAVRRGGRPRAAARRRAVRRAERRRPRAGVRRRPLFRGGARRAVAGAAADRAVLPFPSHEVDPYRGLAPHVGVTSARARALHALALGHGARRRRVGGRAAAARHARRSGCWRRRST